MRVFLMFFVLMGFLAGCQKDAKSVKTGVEVAGPSRKESERPKKTEVESSCPKTLKMLTYNVLAKGEREGVRWPALLELVVREDPDVVAFQESSPAFMQALRMHKGMKKAFEWPRDIPMMVSGGLIVLSKYEIVNQEYHRLPSKVGRGVSYTDIRICKDAPTRFANVHLESMLEDGEVRAMQMKVIFEVLKKSKTSVLLGDYNFGDGEEPETSNIPREYVDAWKALHSKQPGYTWNKERSDMAKRGSFPGESSRRLDRVLMRHGGYVPERARIVGDIPVQGQDTLFPSDHFGVLVEFGRK